MTEPQHEEVEGQMSLFGEGDTGELLPAEIPEFYEEPGGLIIERDRAIYP